MAFRLSRLFLPLAGAALVAVIAVAFWPKRNGERPDPAPPVTFTNKLPEVAPPLAALEPALLADPIGRAAARIEWGPPDVFYWTIRHAEASSAADRAALASRLLERFDRVVIGSPLLAQRLIDALAALQESAALPLLMRVAEAPRADRTDFLQIAAIRALARYPYDPAIADLFARLTGTDQPVTVRHTALTEVLKNEVLSSPEAVRSFLESADAADAIPFLQQVGVRRLADCADACARFLADPNEKARQNALLALLSVGDPRADIPLRIELGSGDAERAMLALTQFRDAQRMPPMDLVRPLLDSKIGEVRKQIAVALAPVGTPEQNDEALRLLERLADDRDAVVRRTALVQVWRHGKRPAAVEWRDKLATGHGNALIEAAELLCSELRDPESHEVVRRRLDGGGLPPADEANLLSGLRHYSDLADAPRYLARIRAAGSAGDARATELTFLSEYAATYLQAIGATAVAPLLDELARPAEPGDVDRRTLLLLDVLRGVAKQADPAEAGRAAEVVFALIADPARAPEVRLAALDTLAFFDDARLGERLFALRESLSDPTLAHRAIVLYATFF